MGGYVFNADVNTHDDMMDSYVAIYWQLYAYKMHVTVFITL